MKKEKKDVTDILFTINRLVSAKLKVIMIYLTVFDVIVDVIKKKEDFRDES